MPPGPLGDAVAALGAQAKITLGAGGGLPRVHSPGAHGRLSARAALARVLGGSGWRAVPLSAGVFRLEPALSGARFVVLAPVTAPGDIVVTATKRDERLSAVPFATTVIRLDAPHLADRIATTAEIAANAEGVGLTNLGPGRNRLFLRGVADSPFNGPTQSTVGVYLDDARLGFAAPDPDLRLVDVARVEVLRGPQGTLYGTGALGGVYRIVTNKPSLDEGWAGRVGVGDAATVHGAPSASFDVAVNAPVADDLAARVVGYATHDGGWIDDRRRGRGSINRVNVAGGRAALRWGPGADWTVDVGGALQRIDVADGQYAVADIGTRARAAAIAQPSGNDFDAVSLAVAGRLAGARLASTTAYVGRALSSRYDADAGAVFDEYQTERLLSHETRLSRTEGDRSWLVGVALLSAHSNLDGHLTSAGAEPRPIEHLRREVLEGALFGEARRTVLKRLDLTLGGRVSDTSIRDDAGAGGVTVTRLRVSPTAALLWRALPGFEVYGRWANAFRPGGLTGTAGAQSRTFSSDKLRSLDFGIRAWRGVIAAEFSLFDIVWRDVQSDLLQSNGLIATANVGRTRILGG